MKQCDVCTGDKVYLTTRAASNWPYILYCPDCGASVGCHVGTHEPLGKMAQGKTRLLRRLAHLSFDQIWLAGLMSRERAKRWMAELLNLQCEFHISTLDLEQLKQVIVLSDAYVAKKAKGNLEHLKAKNYERITRQVQRSRKLNSVHRRRRQRTR